MLQEEDTTVLLSSCEDTAHEDILEQCGPRLNAAAPPPPAGPAADATAGRGSALVAAASLVAATGGLLFGYDIGVVSGAQLQLQRQLALSCTDLEAVVSCMMAGALAASIFGGIIIDSAGRKITIIINAILFVIGATTLAFANSVPVILVGRVVVGFAVSLSAISECIYISEIAPVHRRGMLVSLNELAITLGFLLAFLAGYVFVDVDGGWRYMFGLAVVPAVFQAIGMLFLPRTPHFLLLKRQDRKAERVLQRLTGQQEVRQRLTNIRLAVDEQRDARCADICATQNNMGDRMFIGMGLVFFQQFTGQPNVLNYAPTILQMVGFCGDAASTMATVGLGLVKVVSTVLALLFVDRAGRRTFLLLGSLAMAVCLVGLAAASSAQRLPLPAGAVCTPPSADPQLEPLPTPLPLRQFNATSATPQLAPGTNSSCGVSGAAHPALPYLALCSLMGYVAAYAFGFGPMTWLVLSEIYPPAIKGRAVAVATSLNWLSNMVISATFLQAVELMSVSGTFLGYAGLCLLSASFVFFVVPETRGRSLHEISEDLGKRTMDSRARSHLRRLLGIRKRSAPPQRYDLVATAGGDATASAGGGVPT